MDISPISSQSASQALAQTQVHQHQKAHQAAKAQESDSSALNGSEKLKAALSSTASEVRADKVARAKALVADPNYPSEATLSSVAGLLAGNMGGSSASASVSA